MQVKKEQIEPKARPQSEEKFQNKQVKKQNHLWLLNSKVELFSSKTLFSDISWCCSPQ